MTVFLAYYCFSNMSSRKTGLICTAIYSLNIYRLVCLYTRAAIGEYTAMIFIPLVIYGMWKIYTLPEDSKEHNHNETHIVAAAAFTSTRNTFLCSVFFHKMRQVRRIKKAVISVVMI